MEAVLNIPTPQTSFIGRDDEIDEIIDLLTDPDCRLLTLAGPGGIGKTRLGIEVANRVTDHFPDGVYFVPLTTLGPTDDIVGAMIDATPFEAQQEPYDLPQIFLDYLETKRLLLVLDNFEHLHDRAPLLSDIVGRAPGVKLLVTSREALNLQEEWVRRIEGMALPEADDPPKETSAVQLFLDRAGQVRRPDTLDLASVVEICKLVEGMPLAIELSAGWVNALTPADIAREIRQNIDILTSTRRNVAERHRSMRIVFNHSLQLLGEDERDAFRRLTVFCGGFTREAAEAVAGASFPTLALLVNKSLLHLNADGRYTIHELLRQYVEGADADLRDRHMAYFMAMLADAPLKSAEQMAALDRIERDIGNIRRAWERAVERRNCEAVEGAWENLSVYCDVRTQYPLAVKLFKMALGTGGSPLFESRVTAQMIRMILFGGLEHTLDLRAELNRCLATAREHESAEDEAFCLYLLGVEALINVWRQPRYLMIQIAQEAAEPMRQALEKFRALDAPFYVADALTWLGTAEVQMGQGEEGLAYQLQGLDVRREMGDRHGAAWAMHSLGHTYYDLRQYHESESTIRQAAAMLREFRSIKGIISSMTMLGQVALSKGELEEARETAQEVLRLSRSVDNPEGELSALGLLATLACLLEEDYETGMDLARQSQAIGERAFHPFIDPFTTAGLSFAACGLGDFEMMRGGYPHLFWKAYDDPTGGSMVLALEAVARHQKGDLAGAAELLAAAGRLPDYGTGWLDRWACLARVRADLERRLGEAATIRAWERGSALDPVAVIEGIIEAGQADVQEEANLTLPDPLTEREMEVLGLLAEGMTNREIADQLVLAVGTVKVHARNIYQKLAVSNRTQAVAKAAEIHLI
jgi:predicted ATPase/DNA-binding CsgD family transcriptional regulator